MSRWFATSCVALAVACSAPIVAQAPADTEVSQLDQARARLAAGEPEAAIALVDPIIAAAQADAAKDSNAMCPSVAVAILAQFMARSNPGVSISAENDWCDSMLVKGYALVELKRFGEAAALLGRLVKHDASNANYWTEYAFALRSNGQLDESLKAYKRAKSAASKYSNSAAKRAWRAVALRGIGYIAFERSQWDEAEKAYRDSLKDDPGNSIAQHELAMIKERRAQ